MADDWKPGDLALCVLSERDYLPAGSIHTVRTVMRSETGRLGLTFEDVEPPAGKRGFLAIRFRKINPLTDDERDETWRDLLEPVRA